MDRSYGDIWFTVEPFKINAVICKNRMSGFLDLDVKVGAGEPKIVYLQGERRGCAKLCKSGARIGAGPDLDQAVFTSNNINKSDGRRSRSF